MGDETKAVAIIDLKSATKEELDAFRDLAVSMYAGEPCRFCRRLIALDEVRDVVFSGYVEIDGKMSRASHGACWRALSEDERQRLKDEHARTLAAEQASAAKEEA